MLAQPVCNSVYPIIGFDVFYSLNTVRDFVYFVYLTCVSNSKKFQIKRVSNLDHYLYVKLVFNLPEHKCFQSYCHSPGVVLAVVVNRIQKLTFHTHQLSVAI